MSEVIIFKSNHPFIYFLLPVMLSMNISCQQKLPHFTETNKNILLNPDFASVSIPPNIAPLNFRINEAGDQYIAWFHNSNSTSFIIRSNDGGIKIPKKKWNKLLASTVSEEFYIDVFVKKLQKWEKYNTITNYVTPDSIDNYLVYRLIEPGYETWNKMGIYQRNLENFKETPVMLNRVSDGNCVNCHTFCKNSSNTMMFHMRGAHGGTVIYKDHNLTKIDTKTKNTISAGVYSAWHPSGDYIAYSVNNIVQNFHAIPGKSIEVFDTLTNIILYNVNKNIITSCQNLSAPDRLETFPTWSPDGRYLYFCCAKKQPMVRYDQIRYDLLRIAFNPENSGFGKVDTLWHASASGKSVSFPRISPDGRYLLICLADYGNFTIWHPESDLYILDLTTGNISETVLNSDKTESYHTWSSTGRWIVFSSRRGDGLYTRPYFSYFDTLGRAHKPFILPQRNTEFYLNLMKSYNLPELVTSEVELNPRKLLKVTESVPVKTIYREAL